MAHSLYLYLGAIMTPALVVMVTFFGLDFKYRLQQKKNPIQDHEEN